jgi:outer membrane protein insertion porin family
LTEKGASQIELQGGYGGSGFIGTLGLSFNNFSARNLFNKSAYKPLPMGDGQKVSLRLQASSFFRTYSASFSEPWFGKVRPVNLTTSISYTTQFYNNFQTFEVDTSRSFNILTLSVGISKRLSVPDDYFSLSQSVSYQHYDLNNYNTGLFTFGNGASRNLAYTIGISRSNKGTNPIFPTYGAEISLVGKFTLPYSLFNGINYSTLGEKEEYKYKYAGIAYVGSNGIVVNPGDYLTSIPSALTPTPNSVTNFADGVADPAKVDQKKYNWLEYYKIKFKADWYTKVYGKLVLRSLVEYGFLGAYNNDRGVIPFERYFLGGDGMQNFSMDGRETVALRGYTNNSLTPIDSSGEAVGATIYNKYSLELRYPITLKSAASIYALSFLEAGSSFNSYKNYNPFTLKRSAGVGLRVFMPAFGLLGIDFGYGFDGLPQTNGTLGTAPHGWETHFIIGQQF